MTLPSQPFQVNLHAVVELLSTHIYSRPSVFLRELIQNARDAVMTRIEMGTLTLEEARIRITPVGPDSSELVVSDNGAGMHREDMAELLSTVGQSSKRDIFDLPRTDRLGQFGIGLLSCFMVSDEIIVETRPAGVGEASRWVGRSDGTFTLEALEGASGAQVEVGTRVRLTPRPEARELTSYARIWELATTFAEFLPVTLEVCGPRGAERFVNRTPFFTRHLSPNTLPSSADTPEEGSVDDLHAWALERDLEHLSEYGTELIGAEPLDIIDISVPETGTSGTAFVLPASPSPGAKQATRAYMGGLLVSESLPDLLPEWAFFVRVVLDSTGLTPTASREGFVSDEALAVTKRAIASSLRTWILTLAENDPRGLQRFLAIHDLALRSLAVHDTELARIVLPHFTFETNQGRMLVSEIVAANPRVRYAETTEEFRQLAGVIPSDQVVVNAGYVYEKDLMRMLGEAMPSASAAPVTLGDVIAQFGAVLGPEAEGAERVRALGETALFGLDCDVQVRAFTPEDVPALYVVDPDVLRSMELRRLEESTSGFWGDLMREVTAGTGPEQASESPEAGLPTLATLVLNWNSPLVKMLAGIDSDDQVVASRTVRLVYVQAMLAGHNPLRPADRAILNESLSDMLALSTNLMRRDLRVEDFFDGEEGSES
ncbi:HSP90 family protein [Dermabacter sp. p3-SID358]|uniref:HSP90 family protein n=1 Tax=Dermabacter sp. p3-SID358 TaxID=2916114 RepID=UPI0021A8659F|nr:HSP90 family protein [Dermabacter sp. p3-SID358]MCT1866366.1 HSP90 family protein [Dermabacter sp. p3-SID358]